MIKKITIKDVAREAGVAVSTVSNALNNSDLVTEETKNRILETAKRLNYVPNINGRMLKSGKSKTLCFITSNIRGEYFGRLLDSISTRCEEKGYTLNIVVTLDKDIIINNILGGGFDGFFLFEGERITEKELQMLKNKNITAVILDRKYDSQKLGSVVFDSYKAGYEITNHLIKLGHKDIGFIDSANDIYDCIERKKGFFDSLKENNLNFSNQNILQGSFDEHITFNSMIKHINYLKSDNAPFPSAYVCGNDQSAIGAIKALNSLGYNVPDDISIVGFDDIEVAKYFSPALTTIHNPIEEQGKLAVDLLLELLNDDTIGYSKVLSGNLIIRKSSKLLG